MRTKLMILGGVAALAVAATPVAAAASPEPVTISVAVVLSGNLEASTTAGSFSIGGSLSDAGSESGSGWFAGQGHLRTGDPNSLHSTMRLAGSHGTITIDLVGQFGQLPAPTATGSGRWVVSDATGDYASLSGRGTWTAVADFRDAIAHIGPPRVTFTMAGTVN
jgi:hypothetical protein